jgi:hypothetical protein
VAGARGARIAIGSKLPPRRFVVAIVHMQEYEIGDRSTVNYDFIKEKLGDAPIDGLIVHTAGFDDETGAFRIVDVWETRNTQTASWLG